jgi:hypothetical protein
MPVKTEAEILASLAAAGAAVRKVRDAAIASSLAQGAAESETVSRPEAPSAAGASPFSKPKRPDIA